MWEWFSESVSFHEECVCVCSSIFVFNHEDISPVILKVVAWWPKHYSKWKIFQESIINLCGQHYACRSDKASEVPLPIYRIYHISNSCVYATHTPHTVEQDMHVLPEVLRDATPLTLNNRIKLDSGIVFVQLSADATIGVSLCPVHTVRNVWRECSTNVTI